MPESLAALGGLFSPHAARAFMSAIFVPRCQGAPKRREGCRGLLAQRLCRSPRSVSYQAPEIFHVLARVFGSIAQSGHRLYPAGTDVFPYRVTADRPVLSEDYGHLRHPASPCVRYVRACLTKIHALSFSQAPRCRPSCLSPHSRFGSLQPSIRFSRAVRHGCQVLSDRRRRVSCG